MGVAVTSGAEEQVIPFFDRGLPVEYELVRSIRIVTRADLKTVGILNTEARLFGGLDFQTMRGVPSWLVVDELKKQYEVVQISANTLIEGELDGLLVALPSTMAQDEMDHLLEYINAGNPTLLLIDPLPAVNIGLSPSEKSDASRNPFMRQGPPPKEKGDIEQFMAEIGVGWNKAQIVWDRYNPHPEFAEFPPEIVFVGRGNENPECFNPENNATSGLQELVLIFPGSIRKAADMNYEFTPLMESGMVSGTVNYHQMIQRSFFGMTMNTRGIRRIPNEVEYTLAARITGEIPAKSLNVIVIADIDFISSQFFELRKRGVEGLTFDNVTFFLNCMDILVGDESFVQLRKRRVMHRTLTTVEKKKQDFILTQSQEEQEAEAVAQSELTKAQQRLEEKVSKVLERTDLDDQTKQIMAQNLQETEQKRFDALKDSIEAEKEVKIQSSKENMESQIRRIQNNIKTFAVLAPPIPVFFLGIWIFLRRRRREREGALAARRLRS
jgi:ABC-2 type transport system permease protein